MEVGQINSGKHLHEHETNRDLENHRFYEYPNFIISTKDVESKRKKKRKKSPNLHTAY